MTSLIPNVAGSFLVVDGLVGLSLGRLSISLPVSILPKFALTFLIRFGFEGTRP